MTAVNRAAETTNDPIMVVAEHWTRNGWHGGPHFRASLSVLRATELIRVVDGRALQPFKLTPSRHEALALLYFSRAGELPMGKISQRLMVHPTSVTSTIDTLERLGYVERTAHPSDRRATLARITDAGRHAIQTTCAAMAEAGAGMGTLTEKQCRTLFTTLRTVRLAAGDLRERDHSEQSDPIEQATENWHRHGWPAGDHFRAALSIVRTAELIQMEDATALKPFKLTPSRHEALALLYFSRAGELPMGKISQRLMVHPTSVTSTIDTLERLGYVERTAHPSDRRATLARITDAGRHAIQTTCAAMAEAKSGLASLTDRQSETVFSILRTMREAAGDLR
jgi:DNA-binding MarR family transcriptional regulator